MEGYIIAIGLFAWLGAILWSIYLGVERHWGGFVASAIIAILGFGFAFQLAIQQDAKGPCVHYEMQLYYNAATKTMMPAKVCTIRGEWVTND